MTRQEVFGLCVTELQKCNTLLLEAATGFGKSKIAIDLINNLVNTKFKNKNTSLLLVIAKRVHKQTWLDEINKWEGIKINNLTIICYESLKKHTEESFDFIILDEMHHLNSELRLDLFKTIKFKYFIGLSATIPIKLKSYFRFNYKARVVSCGITTAIENNILPEPQILLYPLQLDNKNPTETIHLNSNIKGKEVHGNYKDYWKLKKQKVHAIIHLTPRQKVNEMNALILHEKNTFNRIRTEYAKQKWLYDCGERLKYLSFLKNDIILKILQKINNQRTITFCKTIEQAEILGENCIHSKNKESSDIYERFNNEDINHITAVNILNENANLVNCKYAIFANLSSSEIVTIQRIGRSLRHKNPVIIVPYYQQTREEEIIEDMFKDYNKTFIRTINSIEEI